MSRALVYSTSLLLILLSTAAAAAPQCDVSSATAHVVSEVVPDLPAQVGARLDALPDTDPEKQALSSLVYIHGTNSTTLAAIPVENPLMRSAGALIRRKLPVFAGERMFGLWGLYGRPGVNQHYVSFARLDQASARGMANDVNLVTKQYASRGRVVTFDTELETLKRIGSRMEQVLTEEAAIGPAFVQMRLTDIMLRINNLRALDPQRYVDDIAPLLVKDMDRLKIALDKKGIDASDAIEVAKKYLSEPVAPIQLDKSLMDPPFPVVFGSTTRDQPGKSRVKQDLFTEEIGIQQMGFGPGGIDVMFAPEAEIPRVRKWLEERGLTGKVGVYPVADLQGWASRPSLASRQPGGR